MPRAYYNEIEPYAAQWLRNLVGKNLIAPGDVDERSIVDVRSDDLKGYTQCHFFAGIGGWSFAARLARWPDDRPIWTGSCPCQPFSVAGKGKGEADNRHLWPEQFRLIKERRPPVWMGEQVAAAVGKNWLDGVYADLESIGYTGRSAIIPACAVDAPHRRDRIWIVADADNAERRSDVASRNVDNWKEAGWNEGNGNFEERRDSIVAHPAGNGWEQGKQASAPARYGEISASTASRALVDANGDHRHWWSGPLQVGWNAIEGETSRGGRKHRAQWRTKPGLGLLANGIPNRVGRLRAYGNAIVPQVAAEVIAAYLETESMRC